MRRFPLRAFASPLFASLLFISLFIANPLAAFEHRSVTLRVGYGAGGGYDAVARLVSRHLGRFLPGSPEVIVENLPGGGSMRLTQLLLGAQPSDGSVIGAIGAGIAYAPVLDPDNAAYDPLDLGWIGSLAHGENMCILAHTSGAATLERFRSDEFLIGASGRSSSTYVLAALAQQALGARFRIVTGFDGVAEIGLAMERGEIAGHCVASAGDLASNGLGERAAPVLRFGQAPIAGYEALPRLADLIADPELRAAAGFVEASVEYDFPLVTPAGTAPEILALYRAAFDAMVEDPAFIADAAGNPDLALAPTTGLELERIIRAAYASDPAVLARAHELIR